MLETGDAQIGTIEGEVLEIDEPRLLRCRWSGVFGDTEVTFELFPESRRHAPARASRRLERSARRRARRLRRRLEAEARPGHPPGPGLRQLRGHSAMTMQTPPIVSAEEWDAARAEMLREGEGDDAGTRRARGRAAPDAVARGRARSTASTARTARRACVDLFDGRTQLIVYRAFLEPGVHGWPDHACVGCSMVADQVAHRRAPQRARHVARVRVTRTAGRHRAREGTHGLGAHALGHDARRLRQGLRRRRVARHQRVHPRRRPGVPHLLHRRPRRRADGQHLELPRHHRARSSGEVGGLTRGLPAGRAVPVVDLARRAAAATATAPAPSSSRSPRPSGLGHVQA